MKKFLYKWSSRLTIVMSVLFVIALLMIIWSPAGFALGGKILLSSLVLMGASAIVAVTTA